MANEFVHPSVGAVLTLAEWESVTAHQFNSQATGDIVYASSATQLSRLGIGATNTVLIVTGGIPAWSATLTSNTITTPTFSGVGTGTWVARWSGGTAVTAAQYEITRDADATNQLHFNVPTGGTYEWSVNDVAEALLTATQFAPGADDGNALGSSGRAWADLFLASGAVIDFNAGDVVLTHSANTLALTGASLLDIAAGIVEFNNALRFDTGVAMVAASYSVGRDADATNQLHLNIPTGATFEFSVNDVAGIVLSATLLDITDGVVIEANEPIRWDTGAAITAANYEVGRDADGTNQLHFNIPTGATFEFSINDSAAMTLAPAVLEMFDDNMVIRVASRGATTTAGREIDMRGGAGGTATTGGAGGTTIVRGGEAGGTGNNNGGRVRLLPGGATGTGLKPLVELLADGGVPTTAVLGAGAVGFKYNAGGTLVAYVNDGGVIKSVSLGSPA